MVLWTETCNLLMNALVLMPNRIIWVECSLTTGNLLRVVSVGWSRSLGFGYPHFHLHTGMNSLLNFDHILGLSEDL
jgi:hypothetical protein